MSRSGRKIIERNVNISLRCAQVPTVIKFNADDTWARWAEDVSERTLVPLLVYQHRILQYNIDVVQLNTDLKTLLVFDWTFQQELARMFDSLLLSYGTKDPTSLSDRLHQRLNNPSNFEDRDDWYLFETGLVGGDNFVIAEQGPSFDQNALYYVLCKGAINRLRERIPTVIYTYTFIPEGNIFIDDDGVVGAWSINSYGTGYILRERVIGTPLIDFVSQPECTFDVLLNLICQIAYTIAFAEEYQISGALLNLASIVVHRADISFPVDEGYLNCAYLITVTEFHQAVAVINGKSVGYITESETFTSADELRAVVRELMKYVKIRDSPFGDLKYLFDEKLFGDRNLDMDEIFDGLKRNDSFVNSSLSKSAAFNVILENFIGDTCNFYRRYSTEQNSDGVSYLDRHHILSQGKDTGALGWIEGRFDSVGVIERASKLILTKCDEAEDFLGRGKDYRPIIDENIVSADPDAYLSNLSQLTLMMSNITRLFNSTVQAVHLRDNKDKGEVFSADVVQQVKEIKELYDRETEMIKSILKKY